jgi:hypothetical protein
MTGDMRFKTLSALLLVVGCADSEVSKTAVLDQEVTSDNGVSVNGVSVNGVSVNGVSMNGVSVNGVSVNGVSVNGVSVNGVSLNGVSVNGVSVNGVSVNGVSVNGVSLNGVSVNGVSVNGTDFVGSQFEVGLSNGGTATLRIDAMGALTGDNWDVQTYSLSLNTDSGWTSLCDGGEAVAVPGSWSSTTGAWTDGSFSFACRGSSVAKCLELGYKTWDGFSDHQHACVRMLRADYCGDGTPHTVNGTQINLYDNAGVQADTESWSIDGEWGPDGALCFNNYRGGTMPACSAKFSTSCGSFSSGALLINERQ